MIERYSKEWEGQRALDFAQRVMNDFQTIANWIGSHWEETPAELRELIAKLMVEANQSIDTTYHV